MVLAADGPAGFFLHTAIGTAPRPPVSANADHSAGMVSASMCVTADRISAELLFAKGPLAEHCSQQKIPFFAYRDFGEVVSILNNAAEFRNRVAQTARCRAA